MSPCFLIVLIISYKLGGLRSGKLSDNKSMSVVQGREEERLDVIEEKVLTAEGDEVRRCYRKGRFLGKGGFATCFEVTALDTHRRYASKIVGKETMKKEHTKQKLLSEIKIHRSLHHRNVVNFEHYFEDSDNVYILLEMCSTDTMNEILRRRKRFSELEVQSHVLQLVEALKYLQSQQVIHRDLKLANLFVNERMEIKLGDFGLAAKLEYEGEKKRTICGTPNYIAPEILDTHIGHSFEVDVWSLGVIIYTMVVGKPPFETQDVQTTYDRIRMCNYTFPEKVAISSQCKELITRILVVDPCKRPTLDQIVESSFLNQGYTVPRLMPPSTVSCPLSKSFIENIIGDAQPPQDMSGRPGSEDHPAVSIIEEELKQPLALPEDPPIISELDLPKYPEHPGNDHTEPTVWVLKWVDYSSKYGIGYLLNNGCTGVCFNDFSKIVMEQEGVTFTYVMREAGHKLDTEMTFPMEDGRYPASLVKKVTLLKHFQAFLAKTDRYTFSNSFKGVSFPVFVKKWLKTRHAILFRFSNKVIQVVFRDRSEVLLSSDTSLLLYLSRQGERQSYQLSEAQADTSDELSKRVKYTLEMLRCLLHKKKKLSMDLDLN